jgi:hypothetical protein
MKASLTIGDALSPRSTRSLRSIRALFIGVRLFCMV